MPTELYEEHCGLLPLAHRFIVIDWSDTRWVIPASVALDFACEYYEEEGWYDDYAVIEEGLSQLHGAELRECIEVNGDLVQTIKDERWREVEPFATKLGDAVMGDPRDKCWWFEEHGGTIEEMTDLPVERQVPLALLWFDDTYKQVHNIEVKQ
jgi:hypothetical protein